ncbi:MAG: PD40 domain-containing protein [FCB group bacterium]|nr:PD40 domain-containing protein [FCB group bacterium]MBL7029206.1 PD40 domain-containing protein [Candidatus Neomarinimicrobiota bacterium]MBL7120510.1 PD40 domain-containing protein [Candidatus Neomarinimicrobiota bacterium]
MIIQWAVILVIFAYTQSVSAQNMWMWNQRTHPELKWQTLETEHFNIHYHQGLESIAEKGALIAEQTYQPIMDQLQVKDFGKTDIVFSAEDEIMNGFAMPSNQIFIWVSQNDVAGHFGGSDKWLKLVVTHEFQHVVQFQAHGTWAGIFGGITIPSWWIEGMAEYMTEVWRVGRSDSRMKIHTYRNTMNQLDAHDDGYAKVLYLAWKYGDSTLVKISNHRLYLLKEQEKYPYWYDFKAAFKDATGQSLADFDEEWRRAMNTYYYGYKAQKETMGEVGEPLPLKGFTRVQSASISPDTVTIAVVGRRDKKMRDYGLYMQSTDSTREVKEIHYGRFNGDPAWSPDSKQLILAEYHRGSHGSLLNDLRLIDIDTKKNRWITENFRALHPVFSHDGKGVFFVAHPSETTQIFYQDMESGKRIQLSNFEGDVQLQDLDLSRDGKKLTFMIQDINGDVDIAIMNRDGTDFQKVTNDPEEDVYPVWSTDASAIIYTSYRNSTPNLYRVNLDSLKITQMTDVAEGIYSRQRLPNSNRIIASTLADVDTVRIRAVEDTRVAPKLGLQIREPFNAWRTKTPDIQLPSIDYKAEMLIQKPHLYQPLKTIRPLFKIIWPLGDALLLMGVAEDALGKHIFQVGGFFPYFGDDYGGYVSYTNLRFLPALHFYGMKNMSLHYYSGPDFTFVENRNGVGLAANIPMNTGGSLSSNHSMRFDLQLMNRNLADPEAFEELLTGSIAPTASSKEFKAALTYSWKSQRPRTDRNSAPRDGKGVLIHTEHAISSFFGENDYSKHWIEGFFNFDIPKLPMILYGRMKYAGQSGTILSQDGLGFSEAGPLYFSTEYMQTIRSSGLFGGPESYSLRGQVGQYPANELIVSVAELRMPLFEKVPIDIFGLGIQNITTALFVDLGYIPESGKQLDTFGGEFKFDISLAKIPVVTLAYGWGGDATYWSGQEYEPYLRMALVNPF